MKTVIATIKPFKLDDVKTELPHLGATGVSVIESKGFGSQNQKRYTELYRGAEYAVSYLPKVDVIITVTDDKVDPVVKAILKAAHTGNKGDGRITIIPTAEFWNIRTGENEAVCEQQSSR